MQFDLFEHIGSTFRTILVNGQTKRTDSIEIVDQRSNKRHFGRHLRRKTDVETRNRRRPVVEKKSERIFHD